MKKTVIIIFLFLSFVITAQNNIDTLKLKKIFQLNYKTDSDNQKYGQRFELSGITKTQKDLFYIVSDDISSVFCLDTSDWCIFDADILKIKQNDDDFEAVLSFGKKIFVSKERGFDEIFKVTKKKKLKSVLKVSKFIPEFDKSNTGAEGFDFDGKYFYVANEGQKNKNRFIVSGAVYRISKKGKYEKILQIAGDITDLKYIEAKGQKYIYVLSRNLCQVIRYDLKTKEIKTVSYRKYEKKDGKQNLFDTGKPYGVGEALLITENEIWIGTDNGRREIKKDTENIYLKKYLQNRNTNNLKMPVIMIFERGEF